jgi:hypothetical protein
MSMNPQSISFENARALVRAESSLKARLGYVGLLLLSAGMTAVVISLWLTEPSLPRRTQFAFGTMSFIGASWCAFAWWALRARRPLFARDRVIAGGMGVSFTAFFTMTALVAAAFSGSPAAYGAFGTGVVMLVAAIAVFTQARRRHAALAARRLELERSLRS